ncbi:MAG: succinate dehydrogenase, cytochrome b556 subunit [Burkholderiales bacterium]|nr:succinate dehydrogenase, cytochrome b556 subunit [Burkholderiales bacterium]
MEARYPARRRPKYLNLLKIRQPLPAIVSILHRISGVLLFFPGSHYFFTGCKCCCNLRRPSPACNPVWISPCASCFCCWPRGFLHHLFAGIRHLMLDLHYGLQLEHARLSSKLVLATGVILTVLAGIWLW